MVVVLLDQLHQRGHVQVAGAHTGAIAVPGRAFVARNGVHRVVFQRHPIQLQGHAATSERGMEAGHQVLGVIAIAEMPFGT